MATATTKTISVRAAAKLAESAKFEMIDVRTPGEYETVHAQGARLHPLDALDPSAVMASRMAPADSPLYIICKSGGRSAKACARFNAAGFENVVSIEGGTDAWAAASLPVQRGGRKVLPMDRQMQITAGLICLTGVVLGFALSAWFFAMPAMVGAGLMMAGLTGFCPMMILLGRMPWNRGHSCGTSCSIR
jgi:rhodanese-related sulfurtransferase